MEIRRLMPGGAAALEAVLLPRIATSMFLLGNLRAAGLIDNGVRFSGTYVGAFDDGVLTGVVAHYWNGMLMPQAGEQVEALWRAMRGRRWACSSPLRITQRLNGPIARWASARWGRCGS